MPSASLTGWRGDRLTRLRELDAQCAASLALVPPNPKLSEENIRGYGLLLSAHFQGFCRDLYTEAAQVVASKVRDSLQLLIQTQFTQHRALDRGNPTLQALRGDFERFGFTLDFGAADTANLLRLQHLSKLNNWRNIAAHHGNVPPTGLPPLSALRDWRESCDGLATSLDKIMYNQLRRLLRREPWPP